jgi:hypothetical protein
VGTFTRIIGRARQQETTSGGLSPTFEPHHLLNDALALFSDFALFASSIRAVFAELARFAAHFDGDKFVDFISTGFTSWHEGEFSSGKGHEQHTGLELAAKDTECVRLVVECFRKSPLYAANGQR